MKNKFIWCAAFAAAAYVDHKMRQNSQAACSSGAGEYRPSEEAKSMAGCNPADLLAMGLNHSRLMSLITVRGMMS